MDKALLKSTGKMQNGIQGFYRTKKYRILIVTLCILLPILILGGVFTGVYFGTRFNGKVILICWLAGAYNHFYQYNPELLDELDMSKEQFESRADLEVICGTSSVWGDGIRRLGIAGVDYDIPLNMSKTKCFIILVDKNNEIIYQGLDAMALATNLKSLNF